MRLHVLVEFLGTALNVLVDGCVKNGDSKVGFLW